SDTTKFAEITATNLDKRIAIVINGQVISTPVVKMRLDNGACSVVLDDAQMAKLFPNVNMEELKSNKR
uniref:SecDF P1 head subdomain-containing protein n=1 Tax=uncultured Bacteroides sp. TaxID=162156 RepID=UPI002604DD65